MNMKVIQSSITHHYKGQQVYSLVQWVVVLWERIRIRPAVSLFNSAQQKVSVFSISRWHLLTHRQFIQLVLIIIHFIPFSLKEYWLVMHSLLQPSLPCIQRIISVSVMQKSWGETKGRKGLLVFYYLSGQQNASFRYLKYTNKKYFVTPFGSCGAVFTIHIHILKGGPSAEVF